MTLHDIFSETNHFCVIFKIFVWINVNGKSAVQDDHL